LLELQDEVENVEKIEAYFSFKKNSVATPAETTPTLENFSPADIPPGTVGLPTLAFATTLGQIRTASNHYNSI
jgi:hypothetical protein